MKALAAKIVGRVKRLPVIRHTRFLYHAVRFERHVRLWQKMGFLVPQESDMRHLRAIWEGRA